MGLFDGGAYKPHYKKLGKVDTWFGADSYTQEFFGTIFWVFLAHLANVFGLGAGFQFGLSWVIVTSIFKGHFNAMTTMLGMMLGGDPLDGFIRLCVQVLAGFMGYSLFHYLGYSDWAMYASDNLALHKMIPGAKEGDAATYDTSGLWAWFRLFLTLCVYFAAAARLNTGEKWIDTILLLGVTFAIGGADFAFAPNRYWFCLHGSWVAQACKMGWAYLAYAICGFAAKYVLDLYDGDTTFDWGLPKN